MNQFTINVEYYADTGVYVATSDDIPGLTLETETVTGLVKAIDDIVPRLLLNNLKIPEDADSEVVVNVSLPPERPKKSNIPPPINKLGLEYSLAAIAA